MTTVVDLEQITDYEVIAKQISNARKAIKQPRVDLTKRLTNISITDTMHGSSTLTLQIVDEEFDLLDSGFFDIRGDGRLDPLEINYPEGTPNWWRITQANPSSEGIIETVWMERPAVYLLSHHGPVKTSRAKKTRAQFFLGLTKKVKAHGGIAFVSQELNVVQAKDKDKTKPLSESERRTLKGGGLHTGEDMKDGSYKFKKGELENAQVVLDAAAELDAPARATKALVEACIVEGPFFRNPIGGEGSSSGILQLTGSKGGPGARFPVNGSTSTNGGRRDIALCAKAFLADGFYHNELGGGGAIAIANRHSDATPGEIAQGTQGSAYPHRYDEHAAAADAIIEAYGGGGGGSSYRQQYNFQIGTEDDPHETYWDGMQRLAEDVNWALFVDGKTVYFDSEMTLIQQKPIAVIARDDVPVIDWSYTWDERKVCTEMQITLVCDPFEFRAGEVFKLNGFGPASTGTTVDHPTKKKPKRPGYWLISEYTRNPADLATTFTLRQPSAPKKEPIKGIATRDDAGDPGTASDLMEIAKHVGNADGNHYQMGGGHGALANLHPPFTLDCSGLVSLVLYRAGLYKHTTGQTSGWFAKNYGKPGKGPDFTVYASDGHVFMQGQSGSTKWRLDTGGNHGGTGKWYSQGSDAWRSTAGFTARKFTG